MRTPANACPECRATLNAASPLPYSLGRSAEAGDFSVCIECGGIHRFDEHLTRVSVTDPAELAEALEPAAVRQLLITAAVVKAARANMRAHNARLN